MSKDINAHCAICGKGYHVCNSCLEQKSFKPWRAITDSAKHYQIYSAIHNYTITKDIDSARQDLQDCDLTDLDTFTDDIKNIIKHIIADKKRSKISKETKELPNLVNE